MKLNVKIDGQNFAVEIVDLQARPIAVTVDGETFEVWPEEALASAEAAPQFAAAALPAAAALTAAAVPAPAPAVAPAVDRVKSVLAPIPGVILSISVKEGDSVTFGQELCILEAMKMKNLIKANRAGKITAIAVSTGDQVRHGQVLMEYGD